jgi:hypothetical protein
MTTQEGMTVLRETFGVDVLVDVARKHGVDEGEILSFEDRAESALLDYGDAVGYIGRKIVEAHS